MAMTGAEVLVKIKAEGAEQVQSEMGRAEKATTGFRQKVGGLGKTLTGTAALGVLQFTGLTGPILGVGAATVKAASDQNEAVSKVGVVFDDNAQTILDWSNTSATAFGLTKTQALDATGTLGNMYTAMGFSTEEAANMSKQFVGLSADLGSFNNVPTPEALAAIQSGLIGEYEPLRRFGILLTEDAVKQKALEMGIWDGNGALTEQQKVLARQELIMEQSTNAQGDFARTSDGLANSTRILRAMLGDLAAEMGQILLPAAQKIVSGLIGLMGVVRNLPGPVKGAIAVIALIAAALGPVLLVISAMMPALGLLGTAFGVLAGAISAPVLLIIGALALLAVAYKTNFLGFGDAVRSVGSAIKGGLTAALNVVKQFVSGFKAAFSALDGNPIAKVLKSIASGLKAIGGDNTPRWLVDVANGFERLGGIVQFAANIFNNLRASGLNPVNAALTTIRTLIPGLTGVINPLLVVVGALTNAFSALRDGDFGRVFDNLKTAGIAAFQALGAAISGFGGLLISAFNAIPWSDLWNGLTDAIEAIEFGDLGRAAAQKVMDGLRAAGSAAGDLWGWLTESLSSAFDSVRTAVGEGIRLAWDKIQDINWRSFIPDLDWGAILGRAIEIGSSILGWVKDTLGSIDWGRIVGSIIEVGSNILAWARGKLGDINWSKIVGSIIEVGSNILAWARSTLGDIQWSKIIGSVIEVGSNILAWARTTLGDIQWSKILGAMIEVGSNILSWARTTLGDIQWSKIIGSVIEVGSNILAWARDALGEINWSKIIGSVIEVGSNILAWARTTLGEIQWAKIVGSLIEVGSNILAWARGKLGEINWSKMIGSMIEVGSNILAWARGKLGDIKWSKIVGSLIEVGSNILAWARGKLGDIKWSKILGAATEVGAGILSWVQGLLGSITWSNIFSGSVDLASVGVSDIVGSIPWPSIPGFTWPSISADAIISFVFGDTKPGKLENPDGVEDNPATPINPGGDDSGDISPPMFSGRGNIFTGGGAGIAQQVQQAMAAAKAAVDTGITEIGSTFTSRVPEWATATGAQMALLTPTAATHLMAVNAVAGASLATVGATIGAVLGTAVAGAGAIMARVPASASANFGPVPAIAGAAFGAMASTVLAQTGSAAGSAAANFTRMQTSGTSATQGLGSAVGVAMAGMATGIALKTLAMQADVNNKFSNMKSQATSQVQALGSSVGSAMSNLASTASARVLGMQMGVSASFNSMRSGGISAAASMSSGVVNAISIMGAGVRNTTASAFGAIAGIIASSGGAAVGTARSIGSNIGFAVAAGINGAAGAVAAAAANIINIANTAMRAAAAIRSPSRLFMMIGGYITRGVAAGLTAFDALRTVRANAGAVVGAVESAMAFRGATVPLQASEGSYRYERPLPPAPSRVGASGASGNVYVVMTRSELEDLFNTVDVVKVLTTPQEIAAAFGGR